MRRGGTRAKDEEKKKPQEMKALAESGRQKVLLTHIAAGSSFPDRYRMLSLFSLPSYLLF
jgi:hypothetical protein